MTIPRAHLVDPDVTRWYHCITRCVRLAFLLGEGGSGRKQWIENRHQELAHLFSIAVGGFAMLDNHFHVLVRLDPQRAEAWSDEEVVHRWGRLFPPRDQARQPLEVSQAWVDWRLKDEGWVATARRRLQSLSWFMKCLKEPLARLVNREEGARGAFFEGRYKSVAILDKEALLATCAYFDLNPVAAGLVAAPEAGEHTSIQQRVEHVEKQGRGESLKAAETGSVAAQAGSPGLEESLWLCPIEDRRSLDSTREGMVEGFTLENYLLLVEYTGRLFREGKASISGELAAVFARLGSDGESWSARLLQLSRGRLLGWYFASSRQQLREVADHLGLHHLANLGGCPARA